MKYIKITDLKYDPAAAFLKAEATPICVIRRSEPVGVLLSFDEYQRLLKQIND